MQVLVKYDFPGRKWFDAAVDLPFALPTSVAGLTLATVYSDEGVIGQLLASFGIQVGPRTLAGGWGHNCPPPPPVCLWPFALASRESKTAYYLLVLL